MGKIDFSRLDLVQHFGSWVKVQVAFYDFIFTSSLKMGAKEFNKRWRDGETVYERAAKAIARTYKTPEAAWESFTASLGPDHHKRVDA